MKVIVHLTIEGTIEVEEEGISPAIEEYGRGLKERRLSKKLSIAQLSQMSGVSQPHICRIERGERSPGGWVVDKLEKALQ